MTGGTSTHDQRRMQDQHLESYSRAPDRIPRPEPHGEEVPVIREQLRLMVRVLICQM